MQNPAPRLILDIGPMASGKSSETIAFLTRYADALHRARSLEKVLLIQRKHGDREAYTKGGISTHNSGLSPSPNIVIRNVTRLDDVKTEELDMISAIGIDEGFYPDLYQTISYWYLTLHKTIRVALLESDAFQESLIPQITPLIALSSHVNKHEAICGICLRSGVERSAHWTILTEKGRNLRSKSSAHAKIDIGGLDKYVPVCFYHMEENRRSHPKAC